MFCIECGEKAEIKYLCSRCFIKDKKLIEIEDMSIYLCKICEKYHNKGLSWKTTRDVILSKLNGMNSEIDETLKGGAIHVSLKSVGLIEGIKKEDICNFKIFIKNRQCNDCSMKSGNYYEAVIQIRGEHQESILNNVKNTIKYSKITSLREKKEGYDIKVTRKGDAGSVIKKIKNDHKIIRTTKLVGEKKGKKLYRDVYCIR